jgi:hypothetical protein
LEGDAREPSSSSSSELFKDWPEANDIAMSVYVALTAEGLSSHASMVDAPRGRQKSCADSFATQQPCSRAASSWRPLQRKTEDVDVPHGRSERTKKVAAETASVAPLLHDGPLSATNFDQSKWEIMYPRFIEEGLVDAPGRANKKNV